MYSTVNSPTNFTLMEHEINIPESVSHVHQTKLNGLDNQKKKSKINFL